MALNLGQAISGAARFRRGYETGQEQAIRLDQLRRQDEIARRQEAAAQQAGQARAGMIREAPTFDPSGTRMPTAEAPTGGQGRSGGAGLQFPSESAQPSSAPPSVRGIGPQQEEQQRRQQRPQRDQRNGQEPQTAQLSDAELEDLSTEKSRVEEAISEGYRLIYDREGRGVDTSRTRERVNQLEQELRDIDARMRGEDVPSADERERLSLRDYPRAAGRAVGEAARSTVDDVQRYIYDPFIESYRINEDLFLRGLGAAGEAVSGAYRGFTGQEEAPQQEPDASGTDISQEEMAEIDRRAESQRSGSDATGADETGLRARAQEIYDNNREDILSVKPDATVEDVYQSLLAQEGEEPTPEQRQQAEADVQAQARQIAESTRQFAGVSPENDLISRPVDEGLTDAYVEGIEGQQRVPVDTQRLLQQREDLARLAQIQAQSGTADGNAKFDEYYKQIQEIDTRLQYLQGMQGVNDFRMRNDPQRLSAVWSAYSGSDIQIQPRTDGNYNIFIEGQLTQEGVDQSQIISAAKLAFSEEARNQLAETQAAQAEIQREAQLARAQEMAKAEAGVAETQASFPYDVALQRLQNVSTPRIEEDMEGNPIMVYRDEQGNVQARQYQPGMPEQEAGFFGGGAQPAQPSQFVDLPVPQGSGPTGGGFNSELLQNWNN